MEAKEIRLDRVSRLLKELIDKEVQNLVDNPEDWKEAFLSLSDLIKRDMIFFEKRMREETNALKKKYYEGSWLVSYGYITNIVQILEEYKLEIKEDD